MTITHKEWFDSNKITKWQKSENVLLAELLKYQNFNFNNYLKFKLLTILAMHPTRALKVCWEGC